MIYLPPRETKQLKQTNRSKIFGDMWASYNLDLQSEQGVIRVSPRMKIAENSTSEANMGLPVAFRHFEGRIFTIAGTRVFKGSTTEIPNTAYTEDTDTGAKTNYNSLYSDMEVFNGRLYTTTEDELMRKATAGGAGTGAWTEIDNAFTSETTPHPLCYFKKYNRLYYVDQPGGNDNFIASIDTAEAISSGSYEVNLGVTGEVVKCMRATSNAIFIATVVSSGGNVNGNLKGSVYEWDGISSTVTNRYELDSAGAMAMCISNDIPYIMDTRGILLEYRGYGFEEIGRLPMDERLRLDTPITGNNGYIHPNGLIPTENGTFLALVNNSLVTGNPLENMNAGVWEWSKENGFVHKMSMSYTESSTITDYGQGNLSAVGALIDMNRYSTSASRNGRYLAGATYYTNATSTAHAVFYDDSNNTLQKAGYLVSSWKLSSVIKEKWEQIGMIFRELLGATDKIILKYRTREDDPIYDTITWNDTSSFHISTDVDGCEGYEVEIVQGVGAGRTFHISSISSSSPWRVNLDETFTGATGTAKARIQNWKKIVDVDQQSIESVLKSIGSAAERIQIKCWMLFTGNGEVYEISVGTDEHTKIK